MTASGTILLIGFIWAIVAAAAGLTAIALAKDNQAVLFLVLTGGLAVIAVAATWRLWTTRKQPADDKSKECERFAALAFGGEVDPEAMRLGAGKVEWEHFVTVTAGTLNQASLTDDEKEYLFSLLTGARAKLAVGVQTPPRVTVFAVFPHQLIEREREVLHHLAMGKNNPEIARELFISVNTVTRHITNIFTKTSTTNRVQAAVYAARRHLV